MALTLNGTTGITSANIQDGAITNADINASAAIDASKLTGVGKVLQVVEAETSTLASTTSSTYADTGLSATITPSSTSSKILILIVQNFSQFNSATGDFRIVRNTTDLRTWGYACGYNTGGNFMPYVPMNYLDSPSTTSAVTYKTTFARTGGSGAVYANYQDGGGDMHSYMHLIEIGA